MQRLLNRFRAFALLSACLAPGCAFEDEPLGGQRGPAAGAFVYACAAASDPLCDTPVDGSGEGVQVPERIAVGATFEVTWVRDGDEETAEVRAASASLLAREQGWVAQRAGLVALYAVAADGRVEAWRHVSLVEASSMVVDGVSGTALQAGDEVSLRAWLIDTDGESLAGGVVFAWLAEPAGIVEVVVGDASSTGTDADNEAVVRAIAPGQVTVRVDAAGVSSSINFAVIGDVEQEGSQ